MRQGSIVVNKGERSWYVILVIRSLDLFTAVNRHLKKNGSTNCVDAAKQHIIDDT